MEEWSARIRNRNVKANRLCLDHRSCGDIVLVKRYLLLEEILFLFIILRLISIRELNTRTKYAHGIFSGFSWKISIKT